MLKHGSVEKQSGGQGWHQKGGKHLHLHVPKLLPPPLLGRKCSRAVFQEACLAFGEPRDVWWNKLLRARRCAGLLARAHTQGSARGLLSRNRGDESMVNGDAVALTRLRLLLLRWRATMTTQSARRGSYLTECRTLGLELADWAAPGRRTGGA